MYEEIARSRQFELLADARGIAVRQELEQIRTLDRLQRLQENVRVARARLGLQPIGAN